MYVILDGFDLSIGILFPTTRIEAKRGEYDRAVLGRQRNMAGSRRWRLLLHFRFLTILMPALRADPRDVAGPCRAALRSNFAG
jgi:hypothetical protein